MYYMSMRQQTFKKENVKQFVYFMQHLVYLWGLFYDSTTARHRCHIDSMKRLITLDVLTNIIPDEYIRGTKLHTG